jgi:hypothetical protein
VPNPGSGTSQTFNIQGWFGGPRHPDDFNLIFTKSGRIKSFTSNLSISPTHTLTYNVGTTIEYVIYNSRTNKKIYTGSTVYFPPFTQSLTENRDADEDISVEQGDVLLIDGVERMAIGVISGTVTVNFI